MAKKSTFSTLRWRTAQWLERRWWRSYLKGKSPEEYLADKRAYWARTLAELDWKPVAGRRVIDAGCGPAGIFIHLYDKEDVSALDPLLDKYETDLPIFNRADYPSVNFLHQPLEASSPEGETYDAIYCFNAINHVADWGLALDALTALAAPGARMIMTSDVHRHAWLMPIFKALPGDALHPQQHDARAYREALEQRGWVVERELLLRTEAIFEYRGWVCKADFPRRP